MQDQGFIVNKAKGVVGINFVRTILELSGYMVKDFGIEHYSEEIIKQVKDKKTFQINRKLSTMPDLVVVDEKTQESWLVEVKYQTRDISGNNTIALTWNIMKDYLEFWKEATLVITSPTPPYCFCVDLAKIETRHKKGVLPIPFPGELWNFADVQCSLTAKFPNVTEENIKKALPFLGVKEEAVKEAGGKP